MKILLIDNHTQHKRALLSSLAGHDVEIQRYRPGLKFNHQGKDLVILSGGGGEGHEIDDKHSPGHLWYEDEMKFVQTCKKPLIGICMGFEIICRAYGVSVEEMPREINGHKVLQATLKGRKLLDMETLKQFEAHKWRVKKTPKNFETLAKSKSGIEMIKHKKRPIIATQFHPEKGGTLGLSNLLQTLTT